MEKISALMDGELDEQQAQQQLLRLRSDPELTQHWHAFHLIGDSMRGDTLLSRQFNHRLNSRLAHEPTVLAPRRSAARRVTAYALSAAASLSAVALVAWVAVSSGPVAPPAEVAQATPAAIAPAAADPVPPALASVPSDGRMNDYLMAHQEFSPSTAIQGLAPYIRSVSIAQPAQGR